VASAKGSLVLIVTWSEPSVSPSSTNLAPHRISGIAHFRYRSGKLILAAAEPFGPIADLVFLFDADAWTVSRLVLVFEIVGHRLLDFQRRSWALAC
jgi:hypothetical protein